MTNYDFLYNFSMKEHFPAGTKQFMTSFDKNSIKTQTKHLFSQKMAGNLNI